MENKFLYHKVPQNMSGTTLHPLSKISENVPNGLEIYDAEKSKYDNTVARKNLLEKVIPVLKDENGNDIKWKDVLHMSPIHPSVIRNELNLIRGDINEQRKLAGLEELKELPEVEYFEIDPHHLKRESTTIYLNKEEDINKDLPENEFIDFKPENLEIYNQLPEETKEYYKKSIQNGERPFLHYMLPHVLTSEPIDVSNVRKVKI